VIGINSQIQSTSGGGEGVGFAVSTDTIKYALSQLRASGKVRYGYVGVSTQTVYPQLADEYDLPVEQGAMVAEVVDGAPADKAGLKGGGKEERFQATLVKPGGDVIVAVNGRKVVSSDDFSARIARFRPGETVTLTIYRGDDRRDVKVKLSERPSELPDN
jgi:2-alkenal reductase